jgi:hypothetical protein
MEETKINYKKSILDLFSSVNNVKVNRTVISEADILEFKCGKDFFQLNTDQLLNDTVFRQKYVKAKGKLLPAFTDVEWIGFVSSLYKRAEVVEALEVSDKVLTGKLFFEFLQKKSYTQVAADGYDLLIEQDQSYYLRLGTVNAWLKNNNSNLSLAELSNVCFELGFKNPGYKVMLFVYDGKEKTREYWEFNSKVCHVLNN